MTSKFSDSAHATHYGHNQTITCKEKNKTFQLQTGNVQFKKVKIDGGVEEKNAQGKRCDFLVLSIKEKKAVEIFIELKGKHITDGKKQLIASFEKYATQNGTTKHYAVLITSHHAMPRSRVSYKSDIKKLTKIFNTMPLIKAGILRVKYIPETQKLQEF